MTFCHMLVKTEAICTYSSHTKIMFSAYLCKNVFCFVVLNDDTRYVFEKVEWN